MTAQTNMTINTQFNERGEAVKRIRRDVIHLVVVHNPAKVT